MDLPICIVRMTNGKISGWIIATDTHDARRKAQASGISDLAAKLYQWESPSAGKYDLRDGYVMLVG